VVRKWKASDKRRRAAAYALLAVAALAAVVRLPVAQESQGPKGESQSQSSEGPRQDNNPTSDGNEDDAKLPWWMPWWARSREEVKGEAEHGEAQDTEEQVKKSAGEVAGRRRRKRNNPVVSIRIARNR